MTTRNRPSIDEIKESSEKLLKHQSVEEYARQQGVDLSQSILRFEGIIEDEDAEEMLRTLRDAMSAR